MFELKEAFSSAVLVVLMSFFGLIACGVSKYPRNLDDVHEMNERRSGRSSRGGASREKTVERKSKSLSEHVRSLSFECRKSGSTKKSGRNPYETSTKTAMSLRITNTPREIATNPMLSTNKPTLISLPMIERNPFMAGPPTKPRKMGLDSVDSSVAEQPESSEEILLPIGRQNEGSKVLVNLMTPRDQLKTTFSRHRPSRPTVSFGLSKQERSGDSVIK